MASRSRKRPVSLTNGPPPAFEPRAKRLRSWKSKRSLLMELPAEIRIKILTELLWQPEPLRVIQEPHSISTIDEETPTWVPRICSFSFCPEVLLVCRALHEEGVNILYDNTIGCEIWCSSRGISQTSFLRHAWDMKGKYVPARSTAGDPRYESPKALLSRVKRLNVVVRVSLNDICMETRCAVREFVQAARLLPLLSEMEIHLHMGKVREDDTLYKTRVYHNENISVQDYRDFALGPFALLRNLKRVTLTGVSSSIAEELGRIMMGQEPVVDLPRMYQNLMLYVDYRISDDQCRLCYRVFHHTERAGHEVDMEDEPAFRKSRSKILNIIADHEAKIVKLVLDDTAPQAIYDGHSPILHDEGEDNESITSEDLQMLSDNEESEEDREFKREQEKKRPSLVRLREVVCRERALL